MGRIRTIKPEFPQSESLGGCSRDARLTFVLLFTLVDDSGRTRAASRMLASVLFPYDEDAPSKIVGWLQELERAGCIQCYQVADNAYLEITNWLLHQKIDKPSKPKYPPPPDCSAKAREDSANPREGSWLDQGREGIKERTKEGIREPRAHDEDLPGQTGRPNLKDSVVLGRLEKQGKDNCSLPTEGEDAEKIITPSCAISGISSHLPDNNHLQDDSWGTGVPETTQQPAVEPPVKAKTPENQPSPVISNDWPESAPPMDEAIKALLRAHPRPAMGYSTVTAAIDQVAALAKERGKGRWDAYSYLLARVEAYKLATDKWPAEEKSFITGVLNWLTNEEYRHDDAIWSRGTAGEGNGAFLDAIIHDVLVEGRSTEPGGRTPPAILDPESLRRKRESARASSLGPRPGFAHRRTF